jgi:hypothetical protein
MKDIFLGFLFIIIGIFLLVFTYKNPAVQIKSADLKGYLGGIGFIILGVLTVLGLI